MIKRFAVIIGLIAPLLMPMTVQATSPAPSGLTVSPAIQEIKLNKDQSSVSFAAQITNNTSSQLQIQISTTDFTSLNQSGAVTFFNQPQVNNPHGLASWISPGLTNVALSPGDSQLVQISIANTDSLAPGGHYGAVLYRVVSPVSSAGQSKVSNNEGVSTLVFLSTFSGGTQAIRLDNTPLGSFAFNLPSAINAVFTDVGNTQTAPRGLVLISGPGGTEVARGIINEESGLILPETSRLYTVSFRDEHKFIYPGTYHLSIIYQAGDGSRAIIYNKSFVIINRPLFYLAIALVVLAVLLVIRGFGPVSSKVWRSRPKK